jgi:hypothetical protein
MTYGRQSTFCFCEYYKINSLTLLIGFVFGNSGIYGHKFGD